MKKNKVLIITGPTATGKSKLSVELAQYFQQNLGLKISIVNFDSILFYKELSVGSCKPTFEEMGGIDHYLIDIMSIKNPINAAEFVNLAMPLISKIHQENQVVFLVGGSGFYLKALMEGMYESGTIPLFLQERSDQLYQKEGITPFRVFLEEVDPETFHRLHPNDHYRIRRAVEHYWLTKRKFSDGKKELEKKKQINHGGVHEWSYLHCYLDIPKIEHREIVQKRTYQIIQNKLHEEVQILLKQGFSGEERPLQSIGYKEMVSFLKGEIATMESCIERIVISTQQLAKAQRTWFKKITEKNSYHPILQKEKIFNDVKEFLSN